LAANLATADYSSDITVTAYGTFNIIVADSEGIIVLDRTLNGVTELDSIDGVTQAGKPGNWTVTTTITSFKGDESYSLSAGN
jgi:hypothetical protein